MKILIENISKEQDKLFSSCITPIWLTEKKLGPILDVVFPNCNIIHNKQFKFDDWKVRPDYQIYTNHELKIIIEFQGHQHFSSNLAVYKDKIRRQTFESLGFVFIEIPYFIQLDLTMAQFYFSKYVKSSYIKDFNVTKFPHGFIHPKASLPYEYSTYGSEKFKTLLNEYPTEVSVQIIKSLKYQSQKLKIPFDLFY